MLGLLFQGENSHYIAEVLLYVVSEHDPMMGKIPKPAYSGDQGEMQVL